MTNEERELNEYEEECEENTSIFRIIYTSKFILLYILAVSHLFYGYYMSNSYK